MPNAVNDFQTPKAVTDYFDQKGLKPAFSWLDVFAEEHAFNFTVAKAVETELLAEFHSSLSEAIAKGQTFENWKADMEPRLRKLGWWGPRQVEDPNGIEEAREVDFSSPRRLRTIFHSNMRSARAAGQWQRIERTKRVLPYILYIRTSSKNPRDEHLAFEGTILPVDHPFWRTHFPPNGWGCKCSVRQLTGREAERLGYDPDKDEPQIVFKKFLNRKTGEISDVPEGIDPGWHTNSGLARAKTLTRLFSETLNDAAIGIAASQIRKFWQSSERNILLNIKTSGVNLPVGVSKIIGDELETQGKFITLYADEARKKLGKINEKRLRVFNLLPEILMRGMVIDEYQDGKRTVLFKKGNIWFKAVVGGRTGFLRLITFYQVEARKAEKLIEDYGVQEQE